MQTTAGKQVLPGILPLLDALEASPRSFLGLLTGNYAEAAEVKLGHFDLWRYFRCGAFGEDAHDRNHLVPIALDRARACGLAPAIAADRVVVVGDTPRDVACAHAHGARIVAVATGEYSAGAVARRGGRRRLRGPFGYRGRSAVASTSDQSGLVRAQRISRVGGSAWESNPASPTRGEQPILKTGKATGPRSLPRMPGGAGSVRGRTELPGP